MWNIITSGFDHEDQTINFGTRSVAETGGCLYEATTAASIQARGEVTENPLVRAETCEWGGLCVAVDASITVFKDQSCREVLLNVTFDSVIDSFATSIEGSFLFACVAGPDIHCIHIPSHGTHVFSRNIMLADGSDAKIVQIFCHHLKDETVHLTLVCSNGEVFRCSNLSLKSISSDIRSGNTDTLARIADSITFEPTATEVCHPISSIDVFYDDAESEIVFGGNGIGIKSELTSPADLFAQNTPFNNLNIVRIIKEELLIMALTREGELLKICSVTLICLQVWNDLPVKDFTLLPCPAYSDDRDMLMLVQSEDKQHSWLQLVSVLSFEVKLRLKVSAISHLVHFASDQQEIMYLECFGTNTTNTIHLKMLVECSPIDRFNRLLRRNKFDEAERYACVFNLDTDEVSKGQAKEFIADLCPWSRKENASNAELTMSKLLTVLDKVQDDRFVCELCISAAVPAVEHVRKLLSYAKKRLSMSKDGNLSALGAKLNALECRLETCEIINDLSDFDTWVSFSKRDLLKECRRLLSVGELHRASVIWTRHLCEIKGRITPHIMMTLLQAIPLGTPVEKLMKWLRHFVPAILTTLPDIFEDMLQWIIHITKSMPLHRQQDWPESGFQCLHQVLDLLKVGANKDMSLNLFHQYSAPNSALKQFISLLKVVTHLKTLKDKYHITTISVGDLMADDKNQAAQALLKNVSMMKFGEFFSGFLEKFVEEWDLDMDTVLFEYVESLVCPTSQEQSDYAPWEFLVATLLSYVKKYEELLNGIVLAVKAAPVPWSDTIEKLAQQGLKLNHPLARDIKNQKKLVAFKLVLKKYNLRHGAHDDFDYVTYRWYIRHIIKRSLEGMLDDCLILCGENTTLVVDTYYYVFDHFTEDGNEDEAFKILDSLEPKPKILYACLRKIIFKLSLDWDEQKSLGKYSGMLPAIERRLNMVDSSSGEIQQHLPIFVNCLKELVNLQILKDKVGIYMKMQDYASEWQREAMLGSLITTRLNVGEDRMPRCEPATLSVLLKFPAEEGIIKYAKRATDYGYIDKAVAVSFPLTSLDTLPFSIEQKLNALMMQMMETYKKSEDAPLAQMVRDVSINACILSTSDLLTDWVTMCEWSGIVLSLSNSSTQGQQICTSDPMQIADRPNKWTFSPIFFDRSVISDKSTAIALVKGIYMLDKEILTRENLHSVVAKLQRENNDLTVLSIISALYHNTDMAAEVVDILWFNAVGKLLLKIILSRRLDMDLGLALLNSIPLQTADTWLKNTTDKFIQDMKRLEPLASLATVFYEQFDNEEGKDFFSGLLLRCIWAKRIVKLGVTPKDACDLEHKPTQVLHLLMHIKEVMFDFLQEFCVAFHLDIKDHMLTYLKIIILGWEPEVKVCDNAEGIALYTVINNEAEVTKKCKSIIEKFKASCKGMIFDMLETLMNKINFYFYETYLIIYELMEIVAPKISKSKDKKLALYFLRKYSRVCQPERLEVETWMEAFPDSHGLPLLSKWRLPFHQFLAKDAWSVVKLEVNLDSYDTWLRVAPIVGLETNAICSVAIRQSIKQVAPAIVSPGQWCLHIKESFLISQIQRCVNKLTDKQSASSALFHVINNTPPGADLLALTKLCYDHASSWRKTDKSSVVQQCYDKVKRKYLDVATLHILYTHGLVLPQYLELRMQPQELIVALYDDPSIIERANTAAMYYPSINEAAEEIAVLHQLKLKKLLILRLDEYLKPRALANAWSDETYTNDAFSPTVIDNTQDEENILKACYILQGNAEIANTYLPYLVTIAYNKSVEDSEAKLQALKCLYAVASEARLEKYTARKISSIRKYMQSLYYIVVLSRFGILYSVPEFESSVKLELVKMIWQLHRRNKKAIELVIQLCYDFNLFQTEVWDLVLIQMANLNMIVALEEHLPRLAEHSRILSSTGYINAWNYLLRIPFNRKDAPLTPDQEKVCLEKLELLQSCPIICSLDLLEIVEQFVLVGCPHLGAIALPFMTTDMRDTCVKKLLEKTNAAYLAEILKKSEYTDFLMVDKAIRILES